MLCIPKIYIGEVINSVYRMERNQSKIHRLSASGATTNVKLRHSPLALRKSRLVRRRLLQVFYTVGFLLSAAAISHASYNFLMEAPYLNVKEPTVTGVSPELAREIEGLIANFTQDSRNILGINATALEEQLNRHPRVRSIKVEKVYPDQLTVKAVERTEVAVIATETSFFLMDSEGYAMEKLSPAQIAQVSLPFISGLKSNLVNEGELIKNDTLKKAINLLQVLFERNLPLYNRISDIEIQTDRASALETLTVHMKGKLDIRFGDSNPVDKLAQLDTLLLKLEAEGVKPFEDLVYIDMRFLDMAAYMDKETAMYIDRGQYDMIEKQLNAAQADYEKKNPQQVVVPAQSSAAPAKPSTSPGRTAPTRTTREPATRTAPATATNHYAPGQGQYYQAPAGNPTNYQYNSQQNQSRQYYQPSRNYPAPQNPPLYNLPANQQR